MTNFAHCEFSNYDWLRNVRKNSMRKVNFILAAAMLMVSAAVMAQQASKVYLTREISPESLVKIYKALGVEAKGRVAVKMSTGEGSNPNYLKPELVKNLIWEVDGTIV